MKTIIDKIKNIEIGSDRWNAQKYLNSILLGTVLSLSYPGPNSSSSINNYQLFNSIIEHEIPSSKESIRELKKQYTGRRNEVISLEEIADYSLKDDVTDQLNKINTDDFEKIMRRISKFNPLIESSSEYYNLDENLVASVIYHESSGNSKAVSPKKALGLMQVTYDSAREVAARNNGYAKKPTRREIMSPEKNIAFGTEYLSGLIDRYNGNVMLGLAAYNMGQRD